MKHFQRLIPVFKKQEVHFIFLKEIRKRNDKNEFQKWCSGETGYPIVDAGMQQLNRTGYMHNRFRMITAGILCKHLLTDCEVWRSIFCTKTS